LAAYGLNALVKTLKNKQDIWYITIVWTIAVALAADWSGLHYIVGGFMAGAVMKKEWFEEKQLEVFKNTVLILMMPTYFLLTGLRTSWEVSGIAVLLLALGLFEKSYLLRFFWIKPSLQQTCLQLSCLWL